MRLAKECIYRLNSLDRILAWVCVCLYVFPFFVLPEKTYRRSQTHSGWCKLSEMIVLYELYLYMISISWRKTHKEVWRGVAIY